MLKKILLLALLGILLWSCEDQDANRDDNPCLFEKSVNVTININLPLYADLQFSGNSVFIRDDTRYIEGVFIQNVGNIFTVLELAEPNDCAQNCDLPTRLEGGEFVYDCGDTTRRYAINGEKRDRQSGEFNMRIYSTRFDEASGRLTITY